MGRGARYLYHCAWAYNVLHRGLRYAVLDDRFRYGGFGLTGRPSSPRRARGPGETGRDAVSESKSRVQEAEQSSEIENKNYTSLMLLFVRKT